jgi:hypothetical protein
MSSDVATMTRAECLSNSSLQEAFHQLHDTIVANINAASIIDTLFANKVVTVSDMEDLHAIQRPTDRCRHLLTLLHRSRNPEAFVQLRLAIKGESALNWLVAKIDSRCLSTGQSVATPQAPFTPAIRDVVTRQPGHQTPPSEACFGNETADLPLRPELTNGSGSSSSNTCAGLRSGVNHAETADSVAFVARCQSFPVTHRDETGNANLEWNDNAGKFDDVDKLRSWRLNSDETNTDDEKYEDCVSDARVLDSKNIQRHHQLQRQNSEVDDIRLIADDINSLRMFYEDKLRKQQASNDELKRAYENIIERMTVEHEQEITDLKEEFKRRLQQTKSHDEDDTSVKSPIPSEIEGKRAPRVSARRRAILMDMSCNTDILHHLKKIMQWFLFL